MRQKGRSDATRRMEQALQETSAKRYVLRLYVTGTTPKSAAAIENLRKICDEYLKDRYVLEVVDIYQQPVLAKGDQILAAPTLIKSLPLPIRRFIGDLADRERILLGLDLKPKTAGERSKNRQSGVDPETPAGKGGTGRPAGQGIAKA